jgi:hypothetical protein
MLPTKGEGSVNEILVATSYKFRNAEEGAQSLELDGADIDVCKKAVKVGEPSKRYMRKA